MLKEAEAKPEKSKASNPISSLINFFGSALKIKQTAPLGVKNKTKNFNKESGIVQGRNSAIHSKEDASVGDSNANKKYLNLNTKSLNLCEEPMLQKCDEVKDKSLKERLKSQKASCLNKDKKVETIVSAKLATLPITPENEDKSKSQNIQSKSNEYNTKSQNIQSESSKNVSLFANRIIKSEHVDEYDDKSEISYSSWKNKFIDNNGLLNACSNHQNITCLENRNTKDTKETDKVDYKLESESDDEDITERGADRISKNKGTQRHKEYQPRKRNQETAGEPSAGNTISQKGTNLSINNYATFESNRTQASYELDFSKAAVDIEKYNVDQEIEKLIADIEIEARIADIKSKQCVTGLEEDRIVNEDIINYIAKMKADDEITNFLTHESVQRCIYITKGSFRSAVHSHRLNNLFGPDNNFVPYTDISSQELKTEARFRLFVSENFSKEICFEKCSKMLDRIQVQEFVSKEHKVIHYLKPHGRTKYKRTNLHDAVKNENLEMTFCILEIHKWYHGNLFEINAKDSSKPKKTALDWAYEKRNTLLIDYLKENLAISLHTRPINTPGT